MKNPHNHTDLIEQLKNTQKEIIDMPKARIVPQPQPAVEVEEEYSLEAQLEKLAERAEEEAAAAQVEELTGDDMGPEEALRQRILEALHTHKNAPSAEQIAAWKAKYGEEGVNVIALDTTNVYVYTYLSGSQWDKINELQQSLAKTQNPDIEKAMREAVIRTAILWPKITSDFFRECRAGLPATLFEQILLSSYFLTPQQAITLTTRI